MLKDMSFHFLFQNWEGNSKYNVEISFDLTSRNYYRAKQAIIAFMPINVQFMPAKTTSNAL